MKYFLKLSLALTAFCLFFSVDAEDQTIKKDALANSTCCWEPFSICTTFTTRYANYRWASGSCNVTTEDSPNP